jgi:hypothetical protein
MPFLGVSSLDSDRSQGGLFLWIGPAGRPAAEGGIPTTQASRHTRHKRHACHGWASVLHDAVDPETQKTLRSDSRCRDVHGSW